MVFVDVALVVLHYALPLYYLMYLIPTYPNRAGRRMLNRKLILVTGSNMDIVPGFEGDCTGGAT